MNHVVHRLEDVLHQVLLVSVWELSLLELLLSVHRSTVLLIVEAKSARGGIGFINRPVLIDKELQEERGLLADVSLEILVCLYNHKLKRLTFNTRLFSGHWNELQSVITSENNFDPNY